MAHKTTALAALLFSLAPGAAEIQLTPAGPTFRSADGSGRPADVPAWRIDAAIAARLTAQLAARKNPLVIDYEHQTLLADQNGKPAPAAGWFKALEWREGQGLFATGVEWTASAAAMIAAGEYRYLSPVFEYNRQTGEVQAVRMAALTNNPGLDGMSAVALKAINDFADFTDFQPEESTPMNETLKKLLATLGLPGDAMEADALSAVAAMKAAADGAAVEIAALKAQKPLVPDPAAFVPVEAVQALQTQLAALTASINKGEADKVIEAALADGRLNPALKVWAEDLGKSDIAALKAYVDQAPAIAALKGMQTNNKTPNGDGVGAISDEAGLAAMKALGMTPEVFANGKE
jgi:phage I-like protein